MGCPQVLLPPGACFIPRCGLSLSLSLFTGLPYGSVGAVDLCVDSPGAAAEVSLSGLPPLASPRSHPRTELGKSTPSHRASLLFRPQEDRFTSQLPASSLVTWGTLIQLGLYCRMLARFIERPGTVRVMGASRSGESGLLSSRPNVWM